MRLKRLLKLFSSAMASLYLAALSGNAIAGDYPNAPIRLIVPFSAGGSTDVIGRILAEKLSKTLGANFVVENKPGAGGGIGSAEVAHATPNGYTLLLATSSTHGINPWLYKNLSYDAAADFTAVTMLTSTDYGLAVPMNHKARSVKDLVKESAEEPLNYGSPGNGTTGHLAAALFGLVSGGKFEHIPYKTAAMTDLIAGRLDFMFDNTSTFIPQTRNNSLRILATTGEKRSILTPDIPTMKEAGFPDYQIIGWFSLLAPAGTPTEIIDVLNHAVRKVMSEPEVETRIIALGNTPMTMTPQESNEYLKSQREFFRSLVKKANLKID